MKIKEFIFNIKMFLQRGKKGYCDEDLWELDHWMAKRLPLMLKEYKEKNMGVPTSLKKCIKNGKVIDCDYALTEAGGTFDADTMEIEFNKDIDYIIKKCEKYNDDNYYLDENLSDNQIREENKKRFDEFKEAMKLYAAIIQDLWW